MTMPVQVIFFEAGIAGGSVNRLLGLLQRWDHNSIPCAVVTFFNKKKAGQLLSLDGPVWSRTYAFQGDTQPELFRKRAGILLPTLHFLTYFVRSFTTLLNNPDAIVYINNTPYAHLPLIIAASVLHRTVICHMRSMNRITRLEKLLLGNVARFVVLCHSAKIHYALQGIPEERIEVVYDSIDLSRFTEHSPVVPSASSSVAVVVGSLFYLKGQDVCLKALALVTKVRPDARLVLVGEGDYEVKLRNLARELGVDQQVAFVGFSEDVPEILRTCAIGILTSRKEGGMPNCVHEYMASSLPVIVADLPGISELVVDGRNGFIIPQESPELLADRRIQLLADGTLRQQMGTCGRQTVQETRFTPEQELKRIVEIIRKSR